MEKNKLENVAEEDQEKVKVAINRWNKFLFSKESDKNLFDYFLEGTKKSQIITQYSTTFLEECIMSSLDKLETIPMHHNMRLKQSFQFLVDNTIEFSPKEETLTKLYENSLIVKKTRISNIVYDNYYSQFLKIGKNVDSKSNKNSEISKFILEKLLAKAKLETILEHYNKVDENLLKETVSIFADVLIQKIEANPTVSDDIILYLYDMENKSKKLDLLDNIVLSPKITESEILTECWNMYSEKEKDIVIERSLMLDIQNNVLETLPGYKKHIKNILEMDVDFQKIVRCKNSIKKKKKIEMYFSLLDEIYNETDSDEKRSNIQDYSRELYIKVIEQERPDLTKGLISIKAEKSIIQTEDVPLFVYKVLLHFPKLMGYHLVNELLGSVKKAGKIKEFSDVFNTSKCFEVGRHRFQFDENMKDEIKYIYHEFLKNKLTEDNKNTVNKPIKRLKI